MDQEHQQLDCNCNHYVFPQLPFRNLTHAIKYSGGQTVADGSTNVQLARAHNRDRGSVEVFATSEYNVEVRRFFLPSEKIFLKPEEDDDSVI